MVIHGLVLTILVDRDGALMAEQTCERLESMLVKFAWGVFVCNWPIGVLVPGEGSFISANLRQNPSARSWQWFLDESTSALSMSQ